MPVSRSKKFSGLLHVFVQLFAFERISCRSSVFCKGGVDMEPKKPLGDVDDLIFGGDDQVIYSER